MMCTRKKRRSSNEADAAIVERPRHGRGLWRALRGVAIRTLVVSAFAAIARRVIARRRGAADAARDAMGATVVPLTGAAEWAPLVGADADRWPVERDVTAPWVDPVDGQCPLSHPVKGNASSQIYHVPDSRFYDMTTPERCYRDAGAAEADGMRAPKR
jgi:hypothetical protein